MDPLSITVSAMTLAAFAAQLAQLGSSYASAVKNQRKEVQRLAREIKLLSEILERISTTFDEQHQSENGQAAAAAAPSVNSNFLDAALAECKTQLKELDEFLRKQMEGTSRLKRLTRRLTWPMKEKETKEWIDRIERQKTNLNLVLQADNIEARGKQDLELAKFNKSLEDARREKTEAKKRRKFRDAMHWLAPATQAENQLAAGKLQEPGTGQRLLQHPAYKNWASATRSLLWLHARPGIGKTISTSMIISELTKAQQIEHIAYFYYDPHKSQTADVYGSILAQLLESSTTTAMLPDDLENYYDNSRNRRPYEHELKDVLLKLLPSVSGNVALVIDGLEESASFQEVLHGLKDIYESRELRLLVTSREEPDTLATLSGFKELELLPSMMRDDIVTFVTGDIERQATLKRLKPALKADIIRVVSRHADGVFRKARDAVDQVARYRTERDVKNALNALLPRPGSSEGNDSGFEEMEEPQLA